MTKLNSAVKKMTKMTKITLLMMQVGIEDGCTVHLAIYSTDQVSMFYILDSFVVLYILPSPDLRRLVPTSCFQGSYREI